MHLPRFGWFTSSETDSKFCSVEHSTQHSELIFFAEILGRNRAESKVGLVTVLTASQAAQ